MSAAMDRARAKAAALDVELAAGRSDLLEDLSAFGGRREGETFIATLRRVMRAREDAALADPDIIADAMQPDAPRNYVQVMAESAVDEAAEEWLAEIERIEALYLLEPVRRAA